MRCGWARNELAISYHDEEWGVPVHDDRRWFEFITLEGAQAGLSWDTILRKRDAYRSAFNGIRSRASCEVRRPRSDETTRGRGDRSQSAENQFHHRQRAGVHRGAERVRQLRRIRLAVRRRPAAHQQVARAEAGARTDGRVGRNEQGSAGPRLQVRGIDNLLRDDAGDRDGERSHGRLREVPSGDAVSQEMTRR